MPLLLKPTTPLEGIRAVVISILLCEKCGEFDACMYRTNDKAFSIKTICNADRLCDDCYYKTFRED